MEEPGDNPAPLRKLRKRPSTLRQVVPQLQIGNSVPWLFSPTPTSWQTFCEWLALADVWRCRRYRTDGQPRHHLESRLATIGQYHRLANYPFSDTHLAIHHTLRGHCHVV